MANEIAGYIGLSRMSGLRRQLDVVTNNIANMNTAAFKAERTVFQEHLERLGQAGGREEQSYVIDSATYRDLSQGRLEATGNPLDLAIEGEGWFAYNTEEGVVYGRDGRLLVDDMGRLSTTDGRPILDINGAEIVLPLEEAHLVDIAADGTVSAEGLILGQIGIFGFDNPRRLERLGNGMLRAPADEVALPALDAALVQGTVEGSNVNPIVEMTRLMQLHRAYEQTAKLNEATGDLQSRAIDRLGRSS